MILLLLELVYFRIADRFNIIDKPNERSSHSTIVLRGGGIIFLLGQLYLGARADGLFDLRTSPEDGGQRMLNALLPGTCVPIHRHPISNENVLCLRGRLDEILYDSDGHETARIHLDPSAGRYGCVIPAGAWHTVEVLEPSVIYEAKDGRYGSVSSSVSGAGLTEPLDLQI